MIADPGERQIGYGRLVLVELVEAIAIDRRQDEIVVRQHDALRSPGGAGRVENDRQVTPLALGDFGEPVGFSALGEALQPRRAQPLISVQMRVIIVLQATRFVVNEFGQCGNAVGHRQHLVDLLLILDHGEFRLRMVEDIGHFFGHRIRIDGNRHRAERLRGGERPVEPRPVCADYGDLVAAFHADRLQAERQRAHLVQLFLPGPALPDAVILEPHGRPAAKPLGVQQQIFGKRIRRRGDERQAVSSLVRRLTRRCSQLLLEPETIDCTEIFTKTLRNQLAP